MSILNKNYAGVPAKRRVAAEISNSLDRIYDVLYNRWTNLMELVWTPPGSVTTEEVLTILDTDAKKAFAILDYIEEFLSKAKPGSTDTTNAIKRPYTINPDNTITLDP